MNCVSIYFCFHNKTRTPRFAWVSVTVPTSNSFVKVEVTQFLPKNHETSYIFFISREFSRLDLFLEREMNDQFLEISRSRESREATLVALINVRTYKWVFWIHSFKLIYHPVVFRSICSMPVSSNTFHEYYVHPLSIGFFLTFLWIKKSCWWGDLLQIQIVLFVWKSSGIKGPCVQRYRERLSVCIVITFLRNTGRYSENHRTKT